MSIALSVDAANPLSPLGAAARIGHHRSRRPPVRVGPRLDVADNGHGDCLPGARPLEQLQDWVAHVMDDTDTFFAPPPTRDYTLSDRRQRATSLDVSERARDAAPDEQHRLLPIFSERAPNRRAPRAAVLVLPQWNADAGGHVGLCRLLAWNGLTRAASQPAVPRSADAARAPPRRLHRQRQRRRGRCRCAVRPCSTRGARSRGSRREGYDRIGILGTSLGSCLALLTTAHEPLIRAEALNHISPYFADVVWRGLSTEHVRRGLDGHVDLDTLRALWKPISPRWYLDRLRDRAHAAGLRALRPDVSRRSLARPRERIPRAERSARTRGPAVRALQHRQDAVQVSRRLDSDAVPEASVTA